MQAVIRQAIYGALALVFGAIYLTWDAPLHDARGNAAPAMQWVPTPKANLNRIIEREAAANDLPAAWIKAVIQRESSFRDDLVGSAGEIGLMQIKPTTAHEMGYRGDVRGLFDPAINIKYGARYLRKAMQQGLCSGFSFYNTGINAPYQCTRYGRAVVASIR